MLDTTAGGIYQRIRGDTGEETKIMSSTTLVKFVELMLANALPMTCILHNLRPFVAVTSMLSYEAEA